MSRHATPRGHLALIAVDQGRGATLDPHTRVALIEAGWANAINRHWRLTELGRTALEDANRTNAIARQLRSNP